MYDTIEVLVGLLLLAAGVGFACYLVGSLACALTGTRMRTGWKMLLGLGGAFLAAAVAAGAALRTGRSDLLGSWAVMVGAAILLLITIRRLRRFSRSSGA